MQIHEVNKFKQKEKQQTHCDNHTQTHQQTIKSQILSINHIQSLSSEKITQYQCFQSGQNTFYESVAYENHNKLRQVLNQKQRTTYEKYFQEVQKQAKEAFQTSCSNEDNLNYHKMKLINQNSWDSIHISFKIPFININNYGYCGEIITYEIVVTHCKMKIKMFNLRQRAFRNLILRKGGFGSIFQIYLKNGMSLTAKRIYFRDKLTILQKDQELSEWSIIANKQQIENALYQYSIYKICSLLGIGPQISNDLGFDLVCYSDAIQFFMETCQTSFTWIPNFDINQFQWRMKFCLRLLHMFRIIHKDIKPENILYSHKNNNFVLSDFGISHSICQQIGEPTLTHKQGTIHYMSPQMSQIKNGVEQQVDLYNNDLYALQVTIKQVSKYLKRKQQPDQQRNENERLQNKFYYSLKKFYEYHEKNIEIVADELHVFIKNLYLQTRQKISYADTLCKNIELFIRVIGIHEDLIEFLIPISQDKRIKLLMKKINEQKRENYHYDKFEILQKEQRVIRIIQKQLFRLESVKELTETECNQMKRLMIYLFDKYISYENTDIQKCKRLLDKMHVLKGDTEWYHIIEQKQLFIYLYQQQLNQPQQSEIQLISKKISSEDDRNGFFEKIGKIFIIKKMYLTALKYLKMITKKCTRIFILIANIYLQKGQSQNAIKMLKQVQKIYNLSQEIRIPQIAQTYYNIGYCYLKSQNYNEAKNNFNEAFKLYQNCYGLCHKKTAGAVFHIAQCYIADRNFQAAINICQKHLNILTTGMGEIQPYADSLMFKLGQSYMQINKFEFAIKIYKKQLLVLNSIHKTRIMYATQSQIYFNLGCCYFELQNYAQALINFNKGLQIKENFFDDHPQNFLQFYYYKARCYYLMKKYNQAITQFRLCRKESKKSLKIEFCRNYIIQCCFRIGICFQELGQKSKCGINYVKGLRFIKKYQYKDNMFKKAISNIMCDYFFDKKNYLPAIYHLERIQQKNKILLRKLLKSYDQIHNKVKFEKNIFKLFGISISQDNQSELLQFHLILSRYYFKHKQYFKAYSLCLLVEKKILNTNYFLQKDKNTFKKQLSNIKKFLVNHSYYTQKLIREGKIGDNLIDLKIKQSRFNILKKIKQILKLNRKIEKDYITIQAELIKSLKRIVEFLNTA